ncbi:hypothetical protein [Prevotella histicola]|uniref:hypothetical protein n=2 Tax=Prevotella histicola TaxID=470565 RepID=UPI0028E69943|nr:hypothetical protein [Prevotella histicola]
MNLRIGKVFVGMLLMLFPYCSKAQVSLVENNVSQWTALVLGYEQMKKSIDKQIKKEAALAALQSAIGAEQRKVRKWRTSYHDYLTNGKNIGNALAGGKNLYIQALRILDNLLLLKKAIKNNPEGLVANIPLQDLYMDVAAECTQTFSILKTALSKGTEENMLDGTSRVQLLWVVTDNLTKLNDKVQTLIECINHLRIINVLDQAVAGRAGLTNGQIARRQRKEWIRRQKDNWNLHRR